MDRLDKTASVSVSCPYPPLKTSSSPDETDDVESLLRILDLLGACEPGTDCSSADCEDALRSVVGGDKERRAEAGSCARGGVAMSADWDVSGEMIAGNLGAGVSFYLVKPFQSLFGRKVTNLLKLAFDLSFCLPLHRLNGRTIPKSQVRYRARSVRSRE